MGEGILMERNAMGMDHNAFTSHRAFVNKNICDPSPYFNRGQRILLALASVVIFVELFRLTLKDDTRTAYLDQWW